MPKLRRFGSRIIDLENVVAAEMRDGVLHVFLSGLVSPFRFQSHEADDVWEAISALAETMTPAAAGADAPTNPNDLVAYSVIDLEADAESPARS
jgi:hypothetical protein